MSDQNAKSLLPQFHRNAGYNPVNLLVYIGVVEKRERTAASTERGKGCCWKISCREVVPLSLEIVLCWVQGMCGVLRVVRAGSQDHS